VRPKSRDSAQGVAGTAADLAELLWLTTHCPGRKERKTPDQIHHFATHFDTTSVDWEEHAIKLAGDSESEFTVTLFELEAKIGAWLFTDSPPERSTRPLVFVNACGTLVERCMTRVAR